MYGWTAEEAIGKPAHQLLQTVFPVPLDEIQAELLRADRWEGELEKMKADGTRVVHEATFDPHDRWAGFLMKVGGESLATRVEHHLRTLKERAEAAERRPPSPA